MYLRIFIAMKTCSLGISVPVEGECCIHIHGSIFGVCALSGIYMPTAMWVTDYGEGC